MAAKKAMGILLDVDYVTREGRSVIRFFVREKHGIAAYEDPSFRPYFFVTVSDFEKAEKALKEAVFGEGVRIASVERAEKQNAEKVLRLVFGNVQQLVVARADVGFVSGVLGKAEHDIPFAKRWLLDNGLEPMNGIEFEAEGKEAKNFVVADVAAPDFKVGAFDLETYSPGRFSDPKKDPILMASFATGKKSVVLSYGKRFSSKKARVLAGEAEVVEGLAEAINGAGLDVLATYNGDLFDFPYVKERASRLGKRFAVSSDGSEPKEQSKGRDNAVRLAGLQHLDVYQMLRFLSRFAVVNLIKFDLESVVARLYGVKKEKVAAVEINAAWDADKNVDRVAEYCAEDSEYTLKIGEQYLPLLVELCRIVKQPLFDVGRASASMLVEYLIMDKCREIGRLIENKPDEAAIQQRLMHPIKGGYVKEPESGLHENLAVLDFSSLYPTIMISHNVSPDSLGCRHEKCREKNGAPNGHWFCLEKKGLVPEIIKSLFEKRMKIKKEAKALDKKDKRFILLNARQQALKILLNSFYGYLGYSRSRFYSRECASAITAWARQYVQWVGSEVEKAGFELLYTDTDSAFLIIPQGKSQADVSAFVEGINKQLPGVMNLELEGFFKRGIFVTKESGEGAKKKYALMDYQGNLKIVGFEYVRRDWSPIAKETQRNVIAMILSEGRPEKAIEIVRRTISDLRDGRVKNSELVVLTQIKRRLDKYDAIGPHVAAAKKAVAKGRDIDVGSVVGYIVTKCGKSISDKAQLQEYVSEGNYDADYYIEHQVVPAVIKVMRELGYSREDLIQGGKQHTLSFFG